MKKIFILLAIIVVLTAISLGIWFYNSFPSSSEISREQAGSPSALYSTDQFSFAYPAEASIQPIPGDGDEIIIIRDSQTDLGFQIYITLFEDSDTNMSPERLKRDIPDLVMRNPQSILIDGRGAGTSFVSEESGERRREVWFAYNGYLYQITAPLNSEKFLENVLKTWKFE